MECENGFEKKYIETEFGKIFYFIKKPFEGKPTVVFLHGLSSNHTTWTEAMKKMNKLGLNSIALDMRGHGYSDKSKKRSIYKLPVFSKDIVKILKKENIAKYILIGYSFGGSIAIDYVSRYSDENLIGLVLVSTNYQSPIKYKKIGFLAYPYYILLHTAAFLLIWQKRKNYLYYEHGKFVGYLDSILNGFKTMPISINYWMLSEMVILNLKENIKKIKTDTIIVNSSSDVFISKKETEEMQNFIPGSRVVWLNHNSHFLATNYQEDVLDVIIDFIKKKV